ncbi:diguanylate cyclase domain-containing protein [Deinococcus hohokamensis]|uniref:Diguanylate cyclase domain-containing protein n=1 Tax=Deinococcus hohokamensis TaxID=309883 RepID=A0ABV9ICU8_9DEIO
MGRHPASGLWTALQEQFQDQVRVFRLGGDEYIVLVPEGRPDEAPDPIQRVERAVGQVRHHPALQEAGASVGLAFRPSDDETAVGMLHTADQRIYQVKRQGGKARDSD